LPNDTIKYNVEDKEME